LVAVRDPTAGFFAFPRALLQRCAPLQPVGYKIALELLVKSRATRIQEIPIQFRPRRCGTSKLTLTQQLRYLWHLFLLYRFTFFRQTPPLQTAPGMLLQEREETGGGRR
jgi:dolichol-phosphate mannosyltransferase